MLPYCPEECNAGKKIGVGIQGWERGFVEGGEMDIGRDYIFPAAVVDTPLLNLLPTFRRPWGAGGIPAAEELLNSIFLRRTRNLIELSQSLEFFVHNDLEFRVQADEGCESSYIGGEPRVCKTLRRYILLLSSTAAAAAAALAASFPLTSTDFTHPTHSVVQFIYICLHKCCRRFLTWAPTHTTDGPRIRLKTNAAAVVVVVFRSRFSWVKSVGGMHIVCRIGTHGGISHYAAAAVVVVVVSPPFTRRIGCMDGIKNNVHKTPLQL